MCVHVYVEGYFEQNNTIEDWLREVVLDHYITENKSDRVKLNYHSAIKYN